MKYCYKVVMAKTDEELEVKVEIKILLGFRPIGGVAVVGDPRITPDGENLKFYQAMVKEEE